MYILIFIPFVFEGRDIFSWRNLQVLKLENLTIMCLHQSFDRAKYYDISVLINTFIFKFCFRKVFCCLQKSR